MLTIASTCRQKRSSEFKSRTWSIRSWYSTKISVKSRCRTGTKSSILTVGIVFRASQKATCMPNSEASATILGALWVVARWAQMFRIRYHVTPHSRTRTMRITSSLSAAPVVYLKESNRQVQMLSRQSRPLFVSKTSNRPWTQVERKVRKRKRRGPRRARQLFQIL